MLRFSLTHLLCWRRSASSSLAKIRDCLSARNYFGGTRSPSASSGRDCVQWRVNGIWPGSNHYI